MRHIFGKRRGILYRTLLLTWIVILLTLAVFIVNIIPYQRKTLVESIESSARLIATSIDQVTVTSVLVEDYSTVVEHCMKVVDESALVAYIVISRKDGFSLLHTSGGWRFENLGGFWLPVEQEGGYGFFAEGVLNLDRVFHYYYRLRYSGMDWGWIHVGLTTEQFMKDQRTLYARTLWMAFISICVGVAVSVIFARRFSQPVEKLNAVTQKIAMGDWNARAEIHTGDELEDLAHSFNVMASALHYSYEVLEGRVAERTSDLANANAKLKKQMAERRRAERQIKKSLEEKS